MMHLTIHEAIRKGTRMLELSDVPDAAYDAATMLAHLLGENALAMRLGGEREVCADVMARYEAMLERRSMREPLQYILGEAPFMGLTFRVEPGVLIPRFDTETLCEEAIRVIKRRCAKVLDIGTGSGALAVSIAKLCPDAAVTAVDVSDKALEIAAGNAKANGVSVNFIKSDCFSALVGERYDLIVSNPPYIDAQEMRSLMREVKYEPELALYGGKDGLDFYRKISREAPQHLRRGGTLLFEIGWRQKDAVSAMVSEHVGEAYALKDLGGNWRVVGAKLRSKTGGTP